MAEKISTLILKVDLDCHLCYKKIRKTLCKLQERENIRSIAYDEKKGTVMVSGPFDPNKLSKKLCCKACKVIKDIQIVENKEKEKPKPSAEPAKPDKEKAKPQPEKDKPKAAAEPAKPEKEKPKAAAEPAKPEKEKSKPAAEPGKPEKEKPKSAPKPNPPNQEQVVMAQGFGQGYPSAWPAGPVCGCGPWYEAHYGGCRCCSCGQTYGWVAAGPPGEGSKACQFFSEEDPTAQCSIM